MIEPTRCPQCGNIVPLDAPRCPACHGDDPPGSPPRAVQSIPAERESNRATFGLGSLMLIITLIAVLLGLFVIDPGLGIGASLLLTPALVRTVVRVKKGKRQGESLDPQQKAVAFLASLGIVLATWLAVGIAFYATCWGFFFVGMGIGQASGQRDYGPLALGFYLGLAAGLVAALVCAFFMIRWLWPIRLYPRPTERKQ